MIIAVYTDMYDNEYIEVANTIEEVIKYLEERAYESKLELNMDCLKVFTGVQVKVTKKVSYTVETI
jgi:hypothetical protein